MSDLSLVWLLNPLLPECDVELSSYVHVRSSGPACIVLFAALCNAYLSISDRKYRVPDLEVYIPDLQGRNYQEKYKI